MSEPIKIKRGMVFRNKTTGKLFYIRNKATGNRHWNASAMIGPTSHKIHEGTLMKFYEQVKS
jgi:hypothetical protein